LLQFEPPVPKIPEEEVNDDDGEEGGEGEAENDDGDEETLLDFDLDEVLLGFYSCQSYQIMLFLPFGDFLKV